jgi:hypothetical protein
VVADRIHDKNKAECIQCHSEFISHDCGTKITSRGREMVSNFEVVPWQVQDNFGRLGKVVHFSLHVSGEALRRGVSCWLAPVPYSV